MLGRALKEVKLPFPDDFFPELVVTQEDDDVYRRAAQTKVMETLREEFPATRFHPAQQTNRWKLIGDRQGVQLYRERGVAQGNAVQVVCVGTINGSMEDVMWGIYSASTPAFKTQRSIMHSDYLDARVLHVLDMDECDEEDTAFSYRFSGIKWLASAASGKLTMHKRDLCWYETMGLATDANGHEVGYLTIQSVRVNECPPFDQFGVVRSSANVCYVFRKQPNGSVGVYMKGEHSVGGKSRSWGSDPVIIEMWLAISNVLDCTHSKRLTRLLRGKDLFCANQSKTCDICDQKVRGLKTPENCKICGKTVCDKCRIAKPIYPSKHTTTFPCLMTFCKRCLSDVKDRTFSRAARTGSFHSDNASSHDSGSSTYRQSLSGQSGMFSMYSSQSLPVRGPPIPRGGPRYPSTSSAPPLQHFTNSGSGQFSPTMSASTSRSGRSYVSSEHSSYSDSMPPQQPQYRPRPAQQQQFRGPVSYSRDQMAPPFPQRRESTPQQYQPVYIGGSPSIDSTYDVDNLESSFRGRVRLSSDPRSISDSVDSAPAIDLSGSRSTRSNTSYAAQHIDLSEDVEDIIEISGRAPPPPPPEPVDVFHEDKLKYINSFSSDESGNLANPSLSSASSAPSEHQKLLERLLQANMTAEATYLLAKYSNNLANNATP